MGSPPTYCASPMAASMAAMSASPPRAARILARSVRLTTAANARAMRETRKKISSRVEYRSVVVASEPRHIATAAANPQSSGAGSARPPAIQRSRAPAPITSAPCSKATRRARCSTNPAAGKKVSPVRAAAAARVSTATRIAQSTISPGPARMSHVRAASQRVDGSSGPAIRRRRPGGGRGCSRMRPRPETPPLRRGLPAAPTARPGCGRGWPGCGSCPPAAGG